MQINIINEAARTASRPSVSAPVKPADSSFRETLDAVQGETSSKHFVEIGDTLSSICSEYLRSTGQDASARNVYAAVDKVSSANGLRDRNRIMAGSELDLSVLGGAPKMDTPPSTLAEAAPAVPAAATAAALEKYSQGIQPDPIKAVAQGPLEPMPIEVAPPSQAAMATLQPGFESLGLRGAPVAPELPLVAARTAIAAAQESLTGVGLLATPGAGTSRIPATAAIEKVVKLMESLVEPLGFTKQASVGDSPWSQILGQPAHLTSEFGIRKDPFTRRWVQHEGLDLAAPEGTTVTPMRAGEVVYSGWQSGYGKMVIVRHDDGLETVYGHGSKLLVRAGERVTEDTPLAEVGSTGRSTGSHLHFEVRKDGSAVDPVPYLTAKGM